MVPGKRLRALERAKMSWSGLPDHIEKHLTPEPNSGCWLWTHTLQYGYGMYWKPDKQPWGRVHRLAYESLKGLIPKGLQIDHLCRTRCCCNPNHLEAVTQRENILRGTAPSAVNSRKTACPAGHLYKEYGYRTLKDRRCRECDRLYSKRKYDAVRKRPK